MKAPHYIFALLLAACNPSEKADINPAADVNYYNASEGISAFPGMKAVYIDVVDTTEINPVQFTDRTATGETFPSLPAAGVSGTVSILSMQQSSGSHRFIYTNGKKRILADTTFYLAPGEKHTFYAYDDPDSLLYRCRILHLKENTSAADDECRFRILHFSYDLGEMNCYFIKEDGTKVFPANLPQMIVYGAYSDFIKIDTTVVGKEGNAYLQFFSGSDTATVRATATIPYHAGRSYAVVVRGLVTPRYVQYTDPADPEHPLQLQLNAGIVARVRAE